MKKWIKSTGVLISAVALSLNSYAQQSDLSVTLFSGTYKQGSYIDFHGELTIAEPFYKNGIKKDHFLPVGENKASSLIVQPGYCVTVADGYFLGGSKRSYGPGTHNTILNLDNRISSISIYKKIHHNCQPKYNVPVLYKGTNFSGAQFNIGLNSGYANPEIYPNFWQSYFWNIWGRGDVNVSGGRLFSSSQDYWFPLNFVSASGQYGTSSLLMEGGGFSRQAHSLIVPECYEVILKNEARQGSISGGNRYAPKVWSKTFTAGNYKDLRIFSDIMSVEYTTKRDASCVAERQATPQIPSGASCTWKQVSTYGTPVGYGRVYTSVGSCVQKTKIESFNKWGNKLSTTYR